MFVVKVAFVVVLDDVVVVVRGPTLSYGCGAAIATNADDDVVDVVVAKAIALLLTKTIGWQ